VEAGRNISEISATGVASAAEARTGADATDCVLIPAWAVAQIEQVW